MVQKMVKLMTNEKITHDMNIKEVIEKYPEVIPVFQKYNMGCIGCIAASFEKLSDIASVHGIDVKTFINDLNDAINK
jgi:hybrid cluster-associated redox disulfide protein